MGEITRRGARQNNLQGIDLRIPHGSLTVVTGVSGSGKSSLALDTLFAEGQRRFVESLSTYARQFLQRLPRPEVEALEGIPPAIAIERKNPTVSPRSTVATASELHDYLRLLFARVGRGKCLECGGELGRDSVPDTVDRVLSWPEGTSVLVMFPVDFAADRRGEELRRDLLGRGFHRLLRGGETTSLEPDVLPRVPAGEAWVVVDRIRVRGGAEGLGRRLADSLETAFRAGEGMAGLKRGRGKPERLRQHLGCASCGRAALDPAPHLFSFNSPYGACPECRGFGDLLDFDPQLVVPDPERSLAEGAVDPWRRQSRRYYQKRLLAFCAREGIPTDVPFGRLPPAARRAVLEGSDGFRGALPFLRRLYRKRYRTHIRFFVKRYMRTVTCPSCGGTRLRHEARAFKVSGRDLGEVERMTVEEAQDYVGGLRLSAVEEEVAGRIRDELLRRLRILRTLGVGYLTLDRAARTLSGGEAQRIALAAALGSGLTGSLYVLDEPTIGLHPRDGERLVNVLHRLRDAGNTVVVVEHDRQVLTSADQVIDLGPGSGREGGRVMFSGALADFRRSSTLTARYMREELRVTEGRSARRSPAGWVVVRGASEHNLKEIDVPIPLGVMVGVTGVSGSGKSTLVHDILYRALAGNNDGGMVPGAHRAIEGGEQVGEVLLIDQSPIGRTPRSNPATYVGAMAPIREAFAGTREARLRGVRGGFFSFNVPGGRCEKCRGEGSLRVEMQFMADVLIPCDECDGTRYRPDALEITLKGKNIHQVLELTVAEACRHFRDYPSVRRRLGVLARVGLGYLTLGQPAPTLSGGEAQRLKVARELDLERTVPALYLLDEPTTGLHFHDVRVLLEVLGELVDRGHTVLVVEHHPDVIWACDYLVDLGPEGGEGGGEVVAAGTPEEVARSRRSHTGKVLRGMRSRSRTRRGTRPSGLVGSAL